MKNICRGKTDSHCIEGQLSGKSTPTNVGPFSPLSLSSTPPSGPLLVSFSPADISVMTLSEPYSLCVHAVPGLDAGPVWLTESLPGMFRIFIGPRNVNNDYSSSLRKQAGWILLDISAWWKVYCLHLQMLCWAFSV